MTTIEIKEEQVELIKKALYERAEILFKELEKLGDEACLQADKKED